MKKIILLKNAAWSNQKSRFIFFIVIVGLLILAFIPVKPLANHKKNLPRIMGADISFLPELEARGMIFYNRGKPEDAIQILKDYGFNYVRLRIFNDPSSDSGYSPKKGFCDLEHCKAMAIRLKSAGMKFLLDFHYSDNWADPGKQHKPSAWKGLDFTGLQQAVFDFTKKVISSLKAQGTLPDMVQVGNEINHGMIWPDGNISHPDTLAALIKAGISAVKEVDPSILIMLHIACGGQNEESRFFLDNMLARGARFDLIGESYYPQWHGTLGQLDSNLRDLAGRYKQDIVVVEYSRHKKEVNDIVFNLPGDKGRGSFIWEPLNTWEGVFDKSGKMKDSLMEIYRNLSTKYKID
jgi:arabinogalactan endo-1,4-beta-galactosidase